MSSSNPPATPYVGLTPYSENDAKFFFGRESERDNIIANLMASRLTVLYGPSGVGKSSVLNAGVAWHMRQLAELTQARAVTFGIDESVIQSPYRKFVVVVFNKWRDNSLAGLAEQIRKDVEKVVEVKPHPDDARTPSSLTQLLRTWTLRTSCDFFIILDQFEDYFVYCSPTNNPSPFDKQFPEVVNDYSLRVNFLVSIKEDALAKLDRFTEYIPNLFNSSLRIEHLSRASAYTAIKKPIDRFNQLYAAKGWKVDIQPQLINAVLDQVGTGQELLAQEGLGILQNRAATSSPALTIEPTYLQLVMTRLWEMEMKSNSRTLQLSTLDNLGGARHIVKTHVDQIMRRLEPKQRRAAMRMFVHLVSPTGHKISQSLNDLALSTRLDQEDIDGVLTTLSSPDVRMLRSVESFGTTRYEIFHDVLVPPILRWRNKYELDDQHKRARIYLASAVGLTVLFLIFLFLAVLFFNQKRETERARKDVENQRALIQAAYDLASRQDRAVPYYKSVMRGHTGAVNSAAFSHNDAFILTSSDDRTTKLWDTQTGELVTSLSDQAPVTNAEFSPDGKLIIAANKNGAVQLWRFNEKDGTVSDHITISAHSQEVNCASFSPDSAMIATSSVDGTAKVWDANTGDLITELRDHTGLVNCSFFNEESSLVVTASVDGTAKVWEVRSGLLISTMSGHNDAVNRAVFDRTGTRVATASTDGTGRIWNTLTGQSLVTLKGHSARVNTIAFSPTDPFVVTSSADKTARVWNMNSGRSVAVMLGHTDRVVSARFSPDGTKVVTASDDNTARVWETRSGKELAELRGHTSKVNSARFSHDGKLVATSSGENLIEDGAKGVTESTARVWDVGGLGAMSIEDVILKADPADYSGPCPWTIKLFGYITVAGRGGTVQYRFVGDKGKTTAEKSLFFESPGTKEVNTAWKLGGPNFPSSSGTFYLEILSPTATQSDPVEYKIRCEFCEKPPPADIHAEVGNLTSGAKRDVVLGWSAVDGAIEYKIEVRLQKGSSNEWQPLDAQPISVRAPETTYKITLNSAKRAQWRIWSKDASGLDCKSTPWTDIHLP
jgi:WD40 repeat protein